MNCLCMSTPKHDMQMLSVCKMQYAASMACSMLPHECSEEAGSGTCGLVLCRHVEDAVGVNVEHDIDLWDAARRGRDAAELNLPSRLLSRVRLRSPSNTCIIQTMSTSAHIQLCFKFRACMGKLWVETTAQKQ